MQAEKIITFVTLLIIAIALWMIFSYTKVTPLTFILGAVIFLITQFILVCAYCFVKIQQTRWQAHTINLHKNKKLDPQEDFKFDAITPNLKLYLNKFTQQAKLFNQKNQIKPKQALNVDKFYFEELEINQPRANVMAFLNQLKNFDDGLNMFTDVLVNFGNDLMYLQKGSIFEKKKFFYFSQFQKSYKSFLPSIEFKDNQVKVLKTVNNSLQKSLKQETVKLPYWSILIDLLKYIGGQYAEIQRMRKSNKQLLGMVHNKVLEEYSALEKKLIGIGKQLNTTLKNLDNLKKDYSKYQNSEININEANNQPHFQIMHQFRKQFYTFKDLERRIKENEQIFKQKNRQKQYYQGKLSMFRDYSHKIYGKPMKTRYLSLVDSYSISVDESLRIIGQQYYKQNHDQIQPPKVKGLVINKNINQTLQAQRRYQKQYFKRVEHFENILQGLLKSMQSLGEFINGLRKVFFNMIQNLQKAHQKRKMAKYFTEVAKKLLQHTIYIFHQLSQLYIVNSKMIAVNQPQLQVIRKQMRGNVNKIISVFSQLDVNEGPIVYKYQATKKIMQASYRQLQQRIIKIAQFEKLYSLHTNRIKKIILVIFVQFLCIQKQKINIGDIHLKIKGMDAKGDQAKLAKDQSTESIDNPHALEQSLDNQNDIRADILQTGQQLSPTYIKFLNQFLFVCYTEWKNSTFFKRLICQQLFVAFNKEPNESFAKIQVSQMEFLGLPPEVVWLKQLKSQEYQAFIDIHLAFRGTIKFKVNTIYKLIRDIPVQVGIQMNQFYCVMRICFVPSYIGIGWFSFIGQPISQFKIIPRIANFSLDFEGFKSMFNNFLLDKLKKNAYPIKKNMLIPASKKDQDLEMIMRRFKVIEQNQS